MTEEKKHWLVRPETIRKLWIISGLILALTVVAQLFAHMHSYFGVDGWFGFNAVYGFVTCVLMVAGSKIIGIFLKRKDSYYDE